MALFSHNLFHSQSIMKHSYASSTDNDLIPRVQSLRDGSAASRRFASIRGRAHVMQERGARPRKQGPQCDVPIILTDVIFLLRASQLRVCHQLPVASFNSSLYSFTMSFIRSSALRASSLARAARPARSIRAAELQPWQRAVQRRTYASGHGPEGEAKSSDIPWYVNSISIMQMSANADIACYR